jgi:hypothetical protein
MNPANAPVDRKAYDRAYYLANRERIRARSKAWSKTNHERVLANAREYRQGNRERVEASKRRWALANAERLRAYRRNYYLEHRQLHPRRKKTRDEKLEIRRRYARSPKRLAYYRKRYWANLARSRKGPRERHRQRRRRELQAIFGGVE